MMANEQNRERPETVEGIDRERLLEHEYDGIREYDNPTPGWWHLIFIGSVLFSIVYFLYYQTSEMSWSIHEKYERSVARYYEKLFGELGELEPTQETILAVMRNDLGHFGLDPAESPMDFAAIGRGIYATNCSQCHAKDGGGINGPNLTDDSYLNVKSVEDLYAVITNGVVSKGMPAWDIKLRANERVIVAAYVASLRGTSPAAPKAAEGTVIPPWPAEARPPVALAR